MQTLLFLLVSAASTLIGLDLVPLMCSFPASVTHNAQYSKARDTVVHVEILLRLEIHGYACPRTHINLLELRWRSTTSDVFYKMSQITLMSPCKLNARCKSWVKHINLLHISGEPMYASIHMIHISSLKLTRAAASHGCTIVSNQFVGETLWH